MPFIDLTKKEIKFKNIKYSKKSIPNLYPIYPKKDNIVKLEPTKLNENEKISCLNDKAFKVLIVNSNNIEYLAQFLSHIFNISFEEAYKNIRLIKNEFDKQKLEDKAYRGDCLIELFSAFILIEMNRTEKEKRNIKYLDRIFNSKILFNGERLSPTSCFLININYYTYEGHNETIEIYSLKNQKGELLTFCKQIMNIYVPNILKKYYNKEELNEIERWVLVMIITDVHEAEKLALEDQILLKFIKEARHMTEYGYLIDELDDAVKERLEYITIGYNEGEDKGKIQKEKEIIQKLHSKGLSIENIANNLELKKEYVQRVIKEQVNS